MRTVDLKSIRKMFFLVLSQEEIDENSDGDIFIDVGENEEEVKRKVNFALKKFHGSKEHRKWEILGIKNEIGVKVGNLEEWELKEIIEKEEGKGRKYYLISWEEKL